MGNWKYVGVGRDGKRTQGSIEAGDEKEARKLLRGQGIRPKKLTPPSFLELDLGMWMVEKGLAAPFTQVDLLNFTKQMAIMVNAGVPIMQCLEIIYKQTKSPGLKFSVKNIATNVSGGKSLAEAMGMEKGFDKLYINLVKAGEAGGILDGILNKLTGFMEKREKIKGQIKSAMTYPTVVVIVGIAVIYAMLTFVVPQFAEMLKETGQEMPWITQMVLDASNFLGAHTIKIIPSVFVFYIVISQFIKTPTGKPIFDKVMMFMPIFGPIVIKGNLASFVRTLGTMLSSGVSLIDALDICIDTLDNSVIAEDMTVVRKAVVEGKTLAEPISKIEYFPEMVFQMVKVGEQTGNVDQMLDKVADVFEQEVEDLIETMTKLIEPMILVFLGGAVAVILVAMYMPIFMQAGG